MILERAGTISIIVTMYVHVVPNRNSRPVPGRDSTRRTWRRSRLRAHVFICIMTYYVEWHMREALAPQLFDDAEPDEQRKKRDPAAPARQSASAKLKETSRRAPVGLAVHSFETLSGEVANLCRNLCRIKSDPSCPTFRQITAPKALQVRALQLPELYPVSGN